MKESEQIAAVLGLIFGASLVLGPFFTWILTTR